MEAPSRNPTEVDTCISPVACSHEKPLFMRTTQSFIRSDLRGLINSLMPRSQERAKRSPDASFRNINLDSSHLNKLQESVSTPNSDARLKKNKLVVKTLSVEKYPSDKSEKSDKPTLREKRLNDAKHYRTFQTRDSSDSQERHSVSQKQNLGASLLGKSQFLRQVTSPTAAKKTEVSMLPGIPFLSRQDDASEALSVELSPKAHLLVRQARTLGSPTNGGSQSCERTPKLKDDSKEIEEWKKNYSEAADPMYESKIRFRRKSRFSESVDTKEVMRSESKGDPLEKIKKPYAQFIKKNFDESMLNKLDTFGTFAFTTVEREDNREIPAFLNETKTVKEPLGSMGVVDLWSHKLVNELAKRARFSEEKKMIEKFAFYRAKEMKGAKTKKPQFTILHRKNENIYKDILARKDFVQFQKRNEELINMSAMQRHLSLQGKNFYKGREHSNEPTIVVDSELKEIQGELTNIFNDLTEFAEKNQDDYIKLLETSNNEKQKFKQRSKSHKGLHQIIKY